MKLFHVVSVLVGTVASVLGETITLGSPVDGDVLSLGQNFTAQVIKPVSILGCTEVGIALSIAHCTDHGDCPQPEHGLGSVLYAGPWTHPLLKPGASYQNFSLQVPRYVPRGPALFILTHFCLIGAGPYPLLEYRNASLTIE